MCTIVKDNYWLIDPGVKNTYLNQTSCLNGKPQQNPALSSSSKCGGQFLLTVLCMVSLCFVEIALDSCFERVCTHCFWLCLWIVPRNFYAYVFFCVFGLFFFLSTVFGSRVCIVVACACYCVQLLLCLACVFAIVSGFIFFACACVCFGSCVYSHVYIPMCMVLAF